MSPLFGEKLYKAIIVYDLRTLQFCSPCIGENQSVASCRRCVTASCLRGRHLNLHLINGGCTVNKNWTICHNMVSPHWANVTKPYWARHIAKRSSSLGVGAPKVAAQKDIFNWMNMPLKNYLLFILRCSPGIQGIDQLLCKNVVELDGIISIKCVKILKGVGMQMCIYKYNSYTCCMYVYVKYICTWTAIYIFIFNSGTTYKHEQNTHVYGHTVIRYGTHPFTHLEITMTHFELINHHLTKIKRR